MQLQLQNSKINSSTDLTITGSKSESNRLLLLKALFSSLEVQNISNSDDSQYMLKALSTESNTVDIHHAGTAMRFLTAYFATLEGSTILLTGSQRMQERPIKILVDALRDLGADIEYASQEGYPPLRITGKRLFKDEVRMKANVSSQYISALVLMATKLENGLKLHLEGKITSVPDSLQGDAVLKDIYKQMGVETTFEGSKIILKKINKSLPISIDSDLANAPDIAQTIVVTCLGLQIQCRLTGLHTLKIKETDRLEALKSEIYKFGTDLNITSDSLFLLDPKPLVSGCTVETFNDHRMAMAFAPLVLLTSFSIKEAEFVSKSFPDFWENLLELGFNIYES